MLRAVTQGWKYLDLVKAVHRFLQEALAQVAKRERMHR